MLANNRREATRAVTTSSEKVLSDFDCLKDLKKRGLNTSFSEMTRLQRKGFSHLAQASSVLVKLLKRQEIKNLNAFLNWLISLKEPFSVFQSKGQSIGETLDWAKGLFGKKKAKCVFDRGGEYENWSRKKNLLDPEKVFVRFRIYQKEEKSFVSMISKVRGNWEEQFFRVTDSLFRTGIQQAFGGEI